MEDNLNLLTNRFLVNQFLFNGNIGHEIEKMHYLLVVYSIQENDMYLDLAIALLGDLMKDTASSKAGNTSDYLVNLASFVGRMADNGMLNTEVDDFYDITDESICKGWTDPGNITALLRAGIYLNDRKRKNASEKLPLAPQVFRASKRIADSLRQARRSALSARDLFNWAVYNSTVQHPGSALPDNNDLLKQIFRTFRTATSASEKIILLWSAWLLCGGEETGKFLKKIRREINTLLQTLEMLKECDSFLLLHLLDSLSGNQITATGISISTLFDLLYRDKSIQLSTGLLLALCEASLPPEQLLRSVATIIDLSNN
ncbi:hypothetical protein [Chitinophaga sp. 22308]|uniref:hypothetical protein n=1 Tax=unclassified Chitinophaga TaxID=2619133 RepID=UPI003F85FAC7